MHRHWKRWHWVGWMVPLDLLEKIHSKGFQIDLSRKCSRCNYVQFRMSAADLIMAVDDRQPHGSWQAAHWADAIPESVWCATCDARRKVVGRFGSVDHDYATAYHLDCGHRYELVDHGR